MAGIEAEILESFLLQLADSTTVPAPVVEGLRSSLSSDRLPKPEQLVALYVASSGDASA